MLKRNLCGPQQDIPEIVTTKSQKLERGLFSHVILCSATGHCSTFIYICSTPPLETPTCPPCLVILRLMSFWYHCLIYYLFYWFVYFPPHPLEYVLHEGRDSCLLCSLTQHISWQLVGINGWLNRWQHLSFKNPDALYSICVLLYMPLTISRGHRSQDL